MNQIISYGRFRCTELTPHKNQGMEITYIEKGMMEWMVEGKTEKVESGSVFFTLPWQVHGSLHPREPENTIWHVLFHLQKDYPNHRPAFRFPENLGFTPEEMKVLSTVFSASDRHCFRATPALRELMPALIGELQSTHELREAQAKTLLRAVLVELKRIVSDEAVNAERHTPSDRRVERLIQSLSAECDRPWSLAEMARICGIQRTQLSNVFQKLTGSSPLKYLSRIRLERAKTLLSETDLKIVHIAIECGYGSSQYFANTFKRAMEMTPLEYRKHCRRLSDEETWNWHNVQFRSEEEERRRVQAFSTG